jgi:hypothetical protein
MYHGGQRCYDAEDHSMSCLPNNEQYSKVSLGVDCTIGSFPFLSLLNQERIDEEGSQETRKHCKKSKKLQHVEILEYSCWR